MALFQHDEECLTEPELRVKKHKKIKQRLENYILKVSNDVPVVIDTGASFSLSPIISDFIGPLKKAPIKTLRGLTSDANVVGQGTVEWKVRDIFGRAGVIRTQAYYVPDAHIRLYSPQTHFQEKDEGRCTIESRRVILETHEGSTLEFPYNHCSNLPLMLMHDIPTAGVSFSDMECLGNHSSMAALMSVADQTNQNVRSGPERASPLALAP